MTGICSSSCITWQRRTVLSNPGSL